MCMAIKKNGILHKIGSIAVTQDIVNEVGSKDK